MAARSPAVAHRANPSITTLGASELSIAIRPRDFDEWTGTRAQLEAEGLVPSGFQWPSGAEQRCWEAGGFEYQLRRVRPVGVKGPAKAWLDADNFQLRRSAGPSGFLDGRLHEKQMAVAEELWLRTPAAVRQMYRHLAAQENARFQLFMGSLSSQGGRHV